MVRRRIFRRCWKLVHFFPYKFSTTVLVWGTGSNQLAPRCHLTFKGGPWMGFSILPIARSQKTTHQNISMEGDVWFSWTWGQVVPEFAVRSVLLWRSAFPGLSHRLHTEWFFSDFVWCHTKRFCMGNRFFWGFSRLTRFAILMPVNQRDYVSHGILVPHHGIPGKPPEEKITFSVSCVKPIGVTLLE